MSQTQSAVEQRRMVTDGKEVDAASGETLTPSNSATGAAPGGSRAPTRRTAPTSPDV